MEIHDEQTQIKGMVVIVWQVGAFSLDSLDPSIPKMGTQLHFALPTKIICVHHCFCDPNARFVIEMMLKITGAAYRKRVKTMHGEFPLLY